MAKKATETKAVPADKATVVADLSAQLNSMLNDSAKQTPCADADVPAKKVASRSSFKGELVIPNPAGGVLSVVPVKTFVAVDEDKVERHMYHSADCKNSLKQGKLVCSGCAAEVEKTAAVKGVEVDGKIVLISDEEMKAQLPMRDGKMKIMEYIDESEINPIYYEDTEFVVPDGTAPVLTAFAMLVEGLKRTGKVAKGVRVKGGREQYFTLRPFGQNGMTLNYLRAEYEVRDCNKWVPTAVDEKLVNMMASLIEATAVPFTAAPQDRGLANVRRLIKQKAAGVTVEVPEQDAQDTAASDLTAALEAALKAQQAKAGK